MAYSVLRREIRKIINFNKKAEKHFKGFVRMQYPELRDKLKEWRQYNNKTFEELTNNFHIKAHLVTSNDELFNLIHTYKNIQDEYKDCTRND